MLEESVDADIKEEISQEVIDHLRRTGPFDEMLMQMLDSLTQHPSYQQILELFEDECTKYCARANLSDARNTLRKGIENAMNSNTDFKSKLSQYVDQMFSEHDAKLKDFYNSKAEPFLQKYLPQLPDDEEIDDTEQNIWLKSENGDIEEISNNDRTSPLDEERLGPVDMDIEDDNDDDEDEIERPTYSPIIQDQLTVLTYSSVSPVSTTGLPDYDDNIVLTDEDEASVVGKPKNSHVPVSQVDNLLKTNGSIDLKYESESSSNADNIEKRRRTRKTSTRYNASDYIK